VQQTKGIKWGWVGIGAAIGAIIAMIVGGLTLGIGLGPALLAMGAGAIAGGAIGGGIATIADAAGTAPAEAQLGGIFTKPTNVDVAEKGKPEAIVPLPPDGISVDMGETNRILTQGMSVDMSETNNLLRDIFIAQGKINDRQGRNIDTKETNQILRELLGSSDKQVSRLGDLGTS
jgi:hypothetical protein